MEPLDSYAIRSLAGRWQGQFAGQLVASDHELYSPSCKIWNAMINRQPALIARCTSAADVAVAVKLARAEGLPISVRGGGHSVAGNSVCQDGLMIDLSLMKGLAVDADRLEMVASPGVLWAEFDAAAEAHGLATTGGNISHTGIAGLTLGGGLGYLMGKHGSVCDNLLSVDLVTAEGEALTASEDENAELFWAMRGAGANFGVVTSFRYRLHPLRGVLAGLLVHPQERAPEFLAFYRDFIANAPEELATTVGFLKGPDGTPLVAVIVVWPGDLAEGERVLEPLRKFGPPVADHVQPMPYTAVQSMMDASLPPGNRYYWKSNFVDAISDGLVKVLHEGAQAMPSPRSMLLLFEIKGAIQRVAKDAMAFDHRETNFEMSIVSNWTEPAEDAANVQWAQDIWTGAQPYVSEAVYANHLTGDESAERVRAAYGDAKFLRLAELKATWDPTNLFSLNNNIPPAVRH